MITTRVRVYRDGSGIDTGDLLIDYLRERGVYNVKGPAQVCYGLPPRGSGPHLNGVELGDKPERLRVMQAAGVSVVPWTDDLRVAAQMQFPLFARKSTGAGAKDLQPVFQPEELPWRAAAGWTWFSSVVPIERELRCWVWRDEVLTTFEKVMQRPEAYTALGRNHGQGFEFQPVHNYGPASSNALLAVRALGLDFGAVDLIAGKDGRIYVLETNLAAGAIRSKAHATLRLLADRIQGWCVADCPERRGR